MAGWRFEDARLLLTGSWTVLCLQDVRLQRLPSLPAGRSLVIDGSGLTALDSAGARAIVDLRARLRQAGIDVTLEGFSKARCRLLALVERELAPPPAIPSPHWLAHLGRAVCEVIDDGLGFLAFVGRLALQALGWLLRPWRIRWRALLAETQRAGVNALFIVGLLSFLMGVVIAYQGGDPLSQYGANIYIVDLVGLTILREIAPLVTAIIMAGRTGSSYTAEIGAMRITEEVDALRSLALEPVEILALPKLAAMLVAMPLLIVFADFTGILGGVVVSDLLFGVGLRGYLERLPQTFLMPSSFWVGLVKAPVFAFLITAIGCHQGFRVRGGATSVGYATTRSVVQSIFLVIVVDALFSILFNKLDL
ncbi:phospholipid/cholesterol/gamma-HCH transport system permease protein [Methylomarinovum caldicuralii]|uniref:Phospholipid/cholesterol/gamma-HCH transport system permease protein n=1 Tax=Methylomarinovum caldicuralii TaxID=438856 RepID=A0AAU9CP81_9GAMM|nr:MlaE family lipid ABC transporter permease subunit [Methylomarinovum caldicuralii]BCX81758.1 phospholipid/cholesterol/gamma-HCH transport system permease protein [Methylomarinovum caldicuralii]